MKEKRGEFFSKNKKGDAGGSDNLTWKAIVAIIIILAVLAALMMYLVRMGSGDLIKSEITAKQLCLIMTGAENGTTINVTSPLIIEKNNQSIVVKKSTIDFGYSYPCNIKNFEIEKDGKNTIINID